jgi:hypothetical protein
MKIELAIVLLVTAACVTSKRVAFHPSDPAFTPAPGPSPAAYTSENIDQVPNVPMRSVGIIEVSVRSDQLERAIELAVAKGRELGCWAVIEHDAFARRASQVWLDSDVAIIRVHGMPPHADHKGPRTRILNFDCVVQGAALMRA